PPGWRPSVIEILHSTAFLEACAFPRAIAIFLHKAGVNKRTGADAQIVRKRNSWHGSARGMARKRRLHCGGFLLCTVLFSHGVLTLGSSRRGRETPCVSSP